MPTVNKVPAGVGKCDNCGSESVRTIGWSLTERVQMGYQGLGSVHLCVACLRSEGDDLAARPPFMEELRARLRAAGVAFAAHAKLDELAALVANLDKADEAAWDAQQRGAAKAPVRTPAPTPPAAPPKATAESASTEGQPGASGSAPSSEAPKQEAPADADPPDPLLAFTRARLVEIAMQDYGLQKPPENATKEQIVARIRAVDAERAAGALGGADPSA